MKKKETNYMFQFMKFPSNNLFPSQIVANIKYVQISVWISPIGVVFVNANAQQFGTTSPSGQGLV